ncbi:MAG: carboxypeptidase regulatory-like domain-containing protein [Planctomycetes bacterium]|nr:carboxypeptidase regulatory-like domain-containing protein [Planctomycetota bacterium]
MSSSQSRSPVRWVVVAIAVVMTVLVWVSMRAQPSGNVVAATVASGGPEGGDARQTQRLGSNESENEREAERASVANAAAASAATNEPAPIVGPKLVLRALRAGSIEAIPGVEFAWAEFPEADAMAYRLWSWFVDGELEARVAAGARKVVADEHGRAEIPQPKSSFAVIASAPGWWGMTTSTEDCEPEIEVQLERDREIAVLVVDGAGQPVGDVPVALRSSYWGNGQDRLRARTSSDGVARLRHVDSVLGQGGAQEWMVALAIAAVKPIGATIDLATLPSEPIRLVLPATGSCEVRLLDERGELAAESFDVTLDAQLPGADEKQRRRADRGAATLIDVHDGVAFFPFVELGAELVAAARRPGNWALQQERGRGPTRAGEKVELELRLGRDVVTFVGRSLDLAGTPLAARQLELRIRVSGDNSWVQSLGSVQTDAEGRFRLDTQVQGEPTQSLTLVAESRDPKSGAASRVSLPLTSPVPKGVLELGDLVFTELPVLLAGVVVDEAGLFVAGASVSGQTHTTEENEQFFDDEEGWWASARTDEQGHFELRGKPVGDEFQVSASIGDRRSLPLVTRRGDGELVVRLLTTGAIVGRVVRDGAGGVESMVVSAQFSDPTLQLDSAMGDVAADGSFAVRRLLPGTYSVSLRNQSSWNDMSGVPDVVVRAGEVTRDPRLDPIDLRGTHFVVRLTIVDENQEPVPRGWFMRELKNAAGESSHEWGPIINGKATVAHDGSGANVRLQAEGFCVVRLEKVLADQTVVLRRSPRARIVVRPVPSLPPGISLGASVAAKGPNGEDSAWIELDANGEGEAQLPMIGTATVTFYAVAGDEENQSWEQVQGVEALIEVASRPGVQRFELELDPTKLAAAIEAVRLAAAGESVGQDQ